MTTMSEPNSGFMKALMSALVPQFVATLATAFATGEGWGIVDSLPLSPDHPWFWPLHQALQEFPDSSISPEAVQVDANYAPFVSAVLRSVKTLPDESPEGVLAAFRAMIGVHSELQKLYGAQDDHGYTNAFLSPIVLAVCRRVAHLSQAAASLSTAPIRSPDSPRSIRDAARQALERTLRVCDSRDDSPNENFAVGDILHPLANTLWRMYAQRRLHTQATELEKTFRALSPSEEERLDARGQYISAAAVSESYYWRGRLGIVLLDFRGAKYWLDKAWRLAPPDAWQQRRSILIRLIPANLLLGLLPPQWLLEEYDLIEAYDPFLRAFKNGDVAGWRKLLTERREWLRARNVWLLLFERGEILVWRNLFRHALSAYYATVETAAMGQCPTWVFVAAAQRTFAGSGELEDGTIVLEDIISVLSSLIDQSLILGYLNYASTTLGMKKKTGDVPDPMAGFPRISTVRPRQIEAIK